MGEITVMATNNFKPFATAANANVMSQADWEALPALLSGFISGPAKSAQVNKAIRQASFIAAALAQYTANKSGLDVLDDGDLNGFISKMGTAFGKDFQALDATLTALAGLATGANKLPYFTGNDTAAQTDLTSVGRDIIGKNTIADILTYLGIDRVEQLNNETKIYAGDDHSIFLSIRIDGLWGIYDPLHGFIPLGIEQGGTGARDAGGARTNLGLGRVEQRAGETVIYCDDKKTAYFTVREDNQWGLFDGVKFVPLGIGQGGTGAGDAAGARTNLGLGNSSTKNTGTTANTVAAGDDSRFSLMLGVGQSWQDVTGNRFSGTVYTNNTGKPIQVFALWNDTPPTDWGYGVGTLTFSGPYDASGLALGFLSLVVPAGDTYFMRNPNISHWWELR